MRLRYLGVIVSGLVASLAGPLATAQSPPKLHYEQDFALNPALAAHPRDVVVFDLEPIPRGRPKGVQHARYRLDAGVHTVCLDDNDPFLTDLILEDGRGKPVLRLHRHRRPKPKSGHREARSRPQCARANLLRADTYTLRAVHAGRSITEAHRVAFLQPGPASPRLVDADGNPADGFWALRPDPGQGRVALVSQWSPSGDMSFTRAFPHTATLLSTGRVLVAGGGFGQDLPPNPELYDPGTGQWTRTGAMVSELSFHTATLLPSGRVLVAGGITNEGLSSSAELYDPGSGLWTPTGAMRTARLFHTATLLPSGQVLIAGGSTTDFVDINAIATAELYDPGSGLWKPTGAMRAPRAGHTATLLASGQVLVAGADDTGTGAELYDPATSNWTPTGAMRVPRARLDKQPVPNHTATLLASGQVLVTGGSEQRSAEIYDPATGPATGHWTPTGAMTQARGSHTATLLASGRVLVSGGTLDFGTPLASAELYDPVSGTWAPTGSLGTARWYHTATRLPAGQVLAAGGNNVDQSFQSTEVYDGTRSAIADLGSAQIDDSALFSFTDPRRPLAFPFGGCPLDLRRSDSSGFWTLFAHAADGPDPCPPQTFFRDTTPLVVTDLGHYRAQLGVKRADGRAASLFLSATAVPPTTLMLNYDQPQPDPAPPATLDVLFRFYPDGTQIGALQEGEVAIFQECGYQGKAAVFALDTPNLAQLTSPVVTLDKSAASIRLGNDTAVILHTGQIYTGTQQIVEANTPCLASTPIGNGTTSSLQIRPLAPTILLSSRSCENCQLRSVDVSGLDLSGMDLKGADLTQATLIGTNLAAAILEQAILDRVSGTDQVSGATVNLSGAFLSSASLRKATLSQGKLYGATLLDADLEGADLGGAFLSNCNDASCSPKVPSAASLGGAHLKNVNLAKADLSGADFSTASFYSSSLVGTGKCTFSNGNCATAAGATMNNTQFNQAYLVGVDFTGAQVQGVQFDGAVLIGANFGGATLAVDPAVGTNSGFQNAFLQGTQLGGAMLTGTSLANAFLDFRAGGNDMFLHLSDVYADFPNWHAPKQPICAFVTYSAPTTVPTANSTLTCPNTDSADPNGCGPASPDGSNQNWNSTLPLGPNSLPPASYLLPATYTGAATAICSPDTAW